MATPGSAYSARHAAPAAPAAEAESARPVRLAGRLPRGGGSRARSWVRDHLVTIGLVGALLVGLALLAYPTVSDWWNSFHQSRAIMGYAETVSSMDSSQYAAMLNEARLYNARLAAGGEQWEMDDAQRAEYESLLNVDGNGVMGYITIPKIDVQLPLYHGTDDSVLQTSIGHLAGTSLPVGGDSTHTVLSGHRGLPSARLFSDLDRLVEGDTFSITILNETLTYEVDQIRVVLPSDLSDLQIEDGKDYCTLVTCTPYGINTHRLLVRGHRVANPSGDAQVVAEAIQVRQTYVAVVLAVPMVLALLAALLVRTGLRGRARRDPVRAYLAGMGLRRPRAGGGQSSSTGGPAPGASGGYGSGGLGPGGFGGSSPGGGYDVKGRDT